MSQQLVKKIGIIAVVTTVSAVFWLYTKPWIDSPFRFSDVSVWLVPLITLIILAPIIVLALMLFKSWLWEFIIIAGVALPFVAVFHTSWLYLTGVVILFLLFIYTDRNTNQELNERTKINSRAIMRRGLNTVITGILVVVSFAYFLSSGVQESANNKELPPTIQQVIITTVGNFLGPQTGQLSPQQRIQSEDAVIAEVISEFTRILGPYFKFFPPILAFGLFLVLRGLSFVFIWFSVWLGQLIFWILRKTEFVTIEEKEVKAEALVRL